MKFFFTAIVLVLDFVISWTNARYVGRYWSESKEVGGSFRTYIVSGYVMAIAGFTMVYGYLLLLVSPVFLQMANADPETILAFRQLTADMIYFLCVAAVIPSGFFIWIRSLKDAWEQRTLSSGLTAGWNSYAQLRNTVDAARNAPSALRRIIKALFGGKEKKKRGRNRRAVRDPRRHYRPVRRVFHRVRHHEKGGQGVRSVRRAGGAEPRILLSVPSGAKKRLRNRDVHVPGALFSCSGGGG